MRTLTIALLFQTLLTAQWVSLPYPIPVPDIGAYNSLSQQACLMDNTGEYTAMFVTVPESGSITHVVFRTGTVTTSQSLTVTLETVGSDGNVSGTMYGGSTGGTVASVASNTYYEVALGTPATATAGDLVGVRIAYTSAIGNLNINSVSYSSSASGYMVCYTGSVNKYQMTPFVRFRYGSTYPMMNAHPSLPSQILFNSGSATNVYGNEFTITTPVRVVGLAGWFYNVSGGGYRLHLRDSSGNVIATALRDVDGDQHTGQFGARVQITPVILSAGTYKVTVEVLSTGSHGFYYWSHYSEEYLRQSLLLPSGWMYCERTSGGAWSNISSRVGLISIVIDKIWSPSGGFITTQ